MTAIIRQRWQHALFASWPLPAVTLQPMVPSPLEVETFQGTAWVSVVALRIAALRLNAIPSVPLLPAFAELNLRTYVCDGPHRGVWFFRIEAASRLGAFIARHVFHAPFSHTPIEMTTGFPTTFEVHGGARSRLSYQTTGVAIDPATNPLAQFLTERSAMFTAAENRKGVYRSDLRHEPWQLQAAAADLDVAAFFRAGGLNEPHTTPTSYWAEAVTTTVTWPTKLQPI